MKKETAMTLSPDAKVVLDAANGFNSYSPDDVLNESRWIVAAALRAVADQVVPAEPENHEFHSWLKDLDFCFGDDIAEWHQWSERMHIRSQLLTIANELEVTHD